MTEDKLTPKLKQVIKMGGFRHKCYSTKNTPYEHSENCEEFCSISKYLKEDEYCQFEHCYGERYFKRIL